MNNLLTHNMQKFMEKEGTKCLDKTSESILREAQRLCPGKTGKLRKSLNIISQGFKREIGSELDYAFWVEMGTEHTAPQPYLRPALNRERRKK